ncbi:MULTISPECIES: secondary thiamine-phosphate synthase enzyme YjbQ [unclassified Halanaerobium]|uniref:secondary thiamine-phosphate synthase enzyme YjbQ n=1 Tax=unclassified Halanaerobium TaxID=2641197 RepID=UPI000DF12173|nr:MULTISPECIES: secondary thiamine-phosphate synthase enzyme YjbQ [unclassified Halanaerobium]RCW40558.1 secondary thiamine-phosphate synthase enzyme [Halanaerobium sp. MA284_MarDTE_T2]RCW78550.1 secondary thiamine-phosphate synthase enzyme [Halanaerobium sp. DL-01]
MLKKLILKTDRKVDFVDISEKIKNVVRESKVEKGTVLIFIPHTTAAVTINENADIDVQKDIVKEINKIVPFEDNYNHIEGNSAAHIKASLLGNEEIVIIENNNLVLGTWQGIYFCEFDGPRTRKFYIKILEG